MQRLGWARQGWAGLGAPHIPSVAGPWQHASLHLPFPGAVQFPPAPLSSEACPGADSAAQPVAAESGTKAALSLDHSSDGGEQGQEGRRIAWGVPLA